MMKRVPYAKQSALYRDSVVILRSAVFRKKMLKIPVNKHDVQKLVNAAYEHQ